MGTTQEFGCYVLPGHVQDAPRILDEVRIAATLGLGTPTATCSTSCAKRLPQGLPGVAGGSDGTTSRRELMVTYNDEGVAQGLPESLFTKSTVKLKNRLMCGLDWASCF